MKKSVIGTTNETTVISALDFLPSIAELAGVNVPNGVKFDGENLSRALTGESERSRSKPLFWNRPPDRSGDRGQTLPDLAMRDGKWKLLAMRDGSNPQLFDLTKDPGETRNLASQYPKIVRRMSEPLLEWWTSQPNPQFVAAKRNR
jgi:uncharacterized sulfatase